MYLLYGGSGAGKSASFVIPNALQLLGSYVFTDPKGELYDKTAGYFKAKGYDVKVLNLVHPQNSDGYNPLHHINNEIDVDIIANTIVKGQGDGGKSSDPFWDDMAEMLMKALIYYLKSKLGKFDSKEIAEVTSTDTINFTEIGNKKTAVYVISSDTHTAYDFLLTIFFSQMIQQLYDFADVKGVLFYKT